MITIQGVKKVYPATERRVAALAGIDLEINRQEFFTILGPSGCGKTTLLRCIAGLERPDGGSIVVDDRVMSKGRETFVPAESRGFGMVFQSYAIWPHMTVGKNVGYPLKVGRNTDSKEAKRRIAAALELVGLPGMAERPATDLSGGQQQRVALARALVASTRLLLLDEPLSNLDAGLRKRMRTELRRLQQELEVTVVYVTHDQDEALAMSDRIAVMDAGRVVAVGKPQELYVAPPDLFVAKFLGDVNVLQGLKVETASPGKTVAVGGGVSIELATDRLELDAGDTVTVCIRPEDVGLAGAEGSGQDAGAISGNRWRVVSTVFLGSYVEVEVERGGVRLQVRCWRDDAPRDGTTVEVDFSRSRVLVFKEGG